jgi:hypothetical protein
MRYAFIKSKISYTGPQPHDFAKLIYRGVHDKMGLSG